MEDYLVM